MAKKKNSKAVHKTKLRLVIFGLSSLAVIVFTTFTIGHYWVEIYDKYREKQDLDNKLTDLKDKEAELRVDVNKLQDPDYIARYAREKYLYSKDGEFIIKIPEK